MHQSVLSLALLAAAPLAEARFPLRFRGAEQQECCPCPKPGESQATVTVTHPGAAETVTVTHAGPAETVTVTHPAPTVYVTHPAQPAGEQPATLTKEITVEPQPSGGPKTVTVVHGKDEPEPQTMATQVIVTKVIEPEQPGPKTITVTKGQEHQNPDQNPKEPVTVTEGHAQETPAQNPNEPVTVTVQPDQPSRPNEQPSVVTKTVGKDEPMEQGTHTMPGAAVTETPEAKTVTKDADHYTTVTQTVGGQGGDNIEIIIINIITGESSCQKKHSGKPCDSKPESIPCPPVSNSTSTATAFNTILVTVGTGTGTGSGHANTTMPMGTPAYPMGTGNANIMGRYPRPAPIRRKW